MAVVPLHPSPEAKSSSRPMIWAIASGKGGVGKSFLAASLGLALSRHHKRVVLVDLDLGGANLHTCLGITHPQLTLSDYLTSRQHINTFIQQLPESKLGLISGAGDGLEIANLKFFQKQKIIRNLKQIDADYVILDLGAGTAFNTLDFFIHAELGIVVVTPDPTSVENTYRFLKCALIRKLRGAPASSRNLLHDVLTLRKGSSRSIRTLAGFVSTLEKLHPEDGARLRQQLDAMNLHLVINQALEPSDTELGPAMALVCQRYFGIRLNYLGYLNHDPMVRGAMKQKQPFFQAYPHSRLAVHISHVSASLLTQTQIAVTGRNT